MASEPKPKKPRKKPKPSALTRPPKRGKKKKKPTTVRPPSPLSPPTILPSLPTASCSQPGKLLQIATAYFTNLYMYCFSVIGGNLCFYIQEII